jgi:hypothetical protein
MFPLGAEWRIIMSALGDAWYTGATHEQEEELDRYG